MRSRITGLGAHLPERVVHNDELGPILGRTAEWIAQRSGIVERRWAAADEGTSDLAVVAAREALADAGLAPGDVDLIVFATYTPDHYIPGSGFFLQAKLRMPPVPVFEVGAMCSGFLYGLSVADRAIRCGDHRRVLLVAAEVHSKGLDLSPEAAGVSMLFGDGAGAVVLEPGERGIGPIALGAQGSFAKALWMPAPGTANGERRLTAEMVERGEHYGQIDGQLVFLQAIETFTRIIRDRLGALDLPLDAIDLFVLHQANARIVERVAERLGVPLERFPTTIRTTGNTSAASLPICLHAARRDGFLRPGMRVLLATFGSGFTWGCTVLTW